MTESNIFENGRTTIPEPVREALGLKAGDGFAILLMADRSVSSLYGR